MYRLNGLEHYMDLRETKMEFVVIKCDKCGKLVRRHSLIRQILHNMQPGYPKFDLCFDCVKQLCIDVLKERGWEFDGDNDG